MVHATELYVYNLWSYHSRTGWSHLSVALVSLIESRTHILTPTFCTGVICIATVFTSFSCISAWWRAPQICPLISHGIAMWAFASKMAFIATIKTSYTLQDWLYHRVAVSGTSARWWATTAPSLKSLIIGTPTSGSVLWSTSPIITWSISVKIPVRWPISISVWWPIIVS